MSSPKPAAIPSAVAIRAAVRPLREQAERSALAHGAGDFRRDDLLPGLVVRASVVRRARPVCGVPAPYAFVQIWYRAWPADRPEPGNGQPGLVGAGADLGGFVATLRQGLRQAQAPGQER